MLQRPSSPPENRVDLRPLLDAAAERLSPRSVPRHHAVHQSRRAVKVLRALLRLLPQDTKGSDAELKAFANALAPARDLRVVSVAAAAAAARCKARNGRKLLRGIAKAKAEAAARLEAEPHPHPRVAALRRHLAALESHVEPDVVAEQLGRMLRKARRRLRAALAARDPEAIHDARTLVVRAQLQLTGLRELAGKRPGRRAQGLDRLRDVLGEHHDHALLREAVADAASTGAEGAGPALRTVDRRMGELERAAARRMGTAFPPSPRRVIRRLGRDLAGLSST